MSGMNPNDLNVINVSAGGVLAALGYRARKSGSTLLERFRVGTTETTEVIDLVRSHVQSHMTDLYDMADKSGKGSFAHLWCMLYETAVFAAVSSTVHVMASTSYPSDSSEWHELAERAKMSEQSLTRLMSEWGSWGQMAEMSAMLD